MNELMRVEESLSPRLRWIRLHDVVTAHTEGIEPGDECPETGEDIFPWAAASASAMLTEANFRKIVGFGDTEDEALGDYCRKHGLLHWTQESDAKQTIRSDRQ